MKVLFVNPSRAGQGNIPLNIPLLIGVLRKHNHEVRLFDFSDYGVFDGISKSYEATFFKEAAFDSTVIEQDRKNFYAYNIYGKEINGINLKQTDFREDFEDLIIHFRPDIIAVSSLSVDFHFACEFLKPYKERYNIPIAVGGIHAILLPEETIASEVCDFVCTGEGEAALPRLLNVLESEGPFETVKGFWGKINGSILKSPFESLTDLTTLPIPAYEDVDPIHFYRPFDGNRYKMLNYELSRGCPYNCSYCVNGVLKDKYKGLGKYHRVKDIDQSIDELMFLRDKYRFDFIRFWDEDFTSHRTDFMEKYAAYYLDKINLPFLIYARVESITEEKVKILKQMGCRTFAMGIESGNENIRRNIMNRKMSNQTIIDKFKLVKSYGIRTSAYNIIGLPQETREAVFDTIELNRQSNPDSFSVTLLEPYKGTPIRKMCEDEGLDPLHETLYNKPQFIPRGMMSNELAGLFRTFPFYIRFPKDRYEEIRLAEADDAAYASLAKEYNSYK